MAHLGKMSALLLTVLSLVGTSPAQWRGRIRVSEGVSRTFVVKSVQPDYPHEARDKQIEGAVILKVVVSDKGDVTEVDVISGDPVLAPAAVTAAKQWKYRPYVLNGEPVVVETRITMNFKLGH